MSKTELILDFLMSAREISITVGFIRKKQINTKLLFSCEVLIHIPKGKHSSKYLREATGGIKAMFDVSMSLC